MDKLPIYTITFKEDLNSNEGIDFVSLVDYPAIEVDWVKFAKAPQKFHFNQDQQMLYGPILIPDKPIYRYSEDLGEYYVNFTKDTVIKLVRKFQAQAKTVNLNYQHQTDSQVKDAVIQEIWLTGQNDKSKDFGFELPAGSAMVGVHIGDSKFWNEEIKSGNVRGFSIEGWLDMQLKSIKKMNEDTKQFVTAVTKDGLTIQTDAPAFDSGVEVYTMEGDQKKPVADGQYELENGIVLTVAAGKITEMVEPVAQELEPEAQQIIQNAMKPIIAAMEKKFSDAIEALKVEFKNQPAGTTPQKENQEKPVQLSAIDKVKQLLEKKK